MMPPNPYSENVPCYLDMNYDATLVVFSYLDPQVIYCSYLVSSFNTEPISLLLKTLCRMAAVNKLCRSLAEANDYWMPLVRRHKTKITIVPRTTLV